MRPIIMDSSKSFEELTNDYTNGIGRPNWISATCEEERNGEFVATLQISADDKYYKNLQNGSIIKLKPNEHDKEKLFIVYKMSKPIDKIVTVECRHLAQYGAQRAIVRPFSATGTTAAQTAIQQARIGDYPFNLVIDSDNETSVVNISEPMTYAKALGGTQGSVLDAFGGEYYWDDTTIRLMKARGSAKDIEIRYGKNLISVTQEENINNCYDAAVGYAIVDEVTYMGDAQYVDGKEVSNPRVELVDFSENWDYEEIPDTETLNNLARQYADNNKINIPTVNLKVRFVNLWETENYKDFAELEHVNLCDTITVLFEDLGVNSTAKVIAYDYDILAERYNSIQLGDPKMNMNRAIMSLSEITVDSSLKIYTDTVVKSTVAESEDSITNTITQLDERTQQMYNTVIVQTTNNATAIENANNSINDIKDTYAMRSELTQTASSLTASIQDNTNYRELASAMLDKNGLHIQTDNAATKSRIDGNGLHIEQGDGTFVAEFTNVLSTIQELKVVGVMDMAAHRFTKVYNKELTDELSGGGNTLGTALYFNGGN